jgi:hypothetical protein
MNKPSERSAERCLRILNVAFGQETVGFGDATSIPDMSMVESAAEEIGPPTSPTSLLVKASSTETFLLNLHPLETLFSIKYKVSQHFKHPADRIKAIEPSVDNDK